MQFIKFVDFYESFHSWAALSGIFLCLKDGVHLPLLYFCTGLKPAWTKDQTSAIVWCIVALFDMFFPVLINSFAFLRRFSFPAWMNLNFSIVSGVNFSTFYKFPSSQITRFKSIWFDVTKFTLLNLI